MRHLPKFSDDYGLLGEDPGAATILSAELGELLDAIGDDWSLDETEELELVIAH